MAYKITKSCSCGRKYFYFSDEFDMGMCDPCLDEELERQADEC